MEKGIITETHLREICQRHAQRRSVNGLRMSLEQGMSTQAIRIFGQMKKYFMRANDNVIDMRYESLNLTFASLVASELALETCLTIFSSFKLVLDLLTEDEINCLISDQPYSWADVRTLYGEYKKNLNQAKTTKNETGQYTDQERAIHMPWNAIERKCEDEHNKLLAAIDTITLAQAQFALLRQLYIFDNPPRRNEYLTLQFIVQDNETSLENVNYVQKVQDGWEVHLHNYKTAQHYGPYIFSLSKTSAQFLDVIQSSKANKDKFCFPAHIAVDAHSHTRYVRKAFVDLFGDTHPFHARILRRIVIEHYQQTGLLNSLAQRKKLALQMGHSVNMQLTVYNRSVNENDVITGVSHDDNDDLCHENEKTVSTAGDLDMQNDTNIKMPTPLKRVLEAMAVLHYNPDVEEQDWQDILQSPMIVFQQKACDILDHYIIGDTSERECYLKNCINQLPAWGAKE